MRIPLDPVNRTRKMPSDTTINYRVLRKKSPQEWVLDLEEVPEHVRPSVARIVWWDFFGGKLCLERVTEFDQWLKHDPREVSEKEVEAGLRMVGFCSFTASKRSQGGDLCR